MTTAARPRILLADDHVIVGEGLQRLLSAEFDVVASARDGVELVRMAREHEPDVVVTDISMPGLTGLEALRTLREGGLRAPFIVLTMHDDAQLALEAFRSGAAGYLLKSSAGDELVRAVHEVLDGRMYLSSTITRDVLTAFIQTPGEETAGGSAASRLTTRQREVLQLVAEGMSLKAIARELDISRRTVESHKYELMRNLGVSTTAELVLAAIRLGVIAIPRGPET